MPIAWTPTIDRALAVAARCHAGQTRKDDPTPYIAHPVAVAMIVSDFTDDEDVVVAALLHDVLEDVPPSVFSADDMTAGFGPRVTELVRGVSEAKTAGEETPPWRVRKEGYLARLAEAPPECLLISLPTRFTTCVRWSPRTTGGARRCGACSTPARMTRCGSTTR